MDGSLKNRVPFEKLPELEKYVLHRLWNVNDEVQKMFNEFNFSKAFQIILNFCNTELSAFFFDIRKDSLYCDSSNSLSVNSSKTVMSFLFENLIRWFLLYYHLQLKRHGSHGEKKLIMV